MSQFPTDNVEVINNENDKETILKFRIAVSECITDNNHDKKVREFFRNIADLKNTYDSKRTGNLCVCFSAAYCRQEIRSMKDVTLEDDDEVIIPEELTNGMIAFEKCLDLMKNGWQKIKDKRNRKLGIKPRRESVGKLEELDDGDVKWKRGRQNKNMTCPLDYFVKAMWLAAIVTEKIQPPNTKCQYTGRWKTQFCDFEWNKLESEDNNKKTPGNKKIKREQRRSNQKEWVEYMRPFDNMDAVFPCNNEITSSDRVASANMLVNENVIPTKTQKEKQKKKKINEKMQLSIETVASDNKKKSTDPVASANRSRDSIPLDNDIISRPKRKRKNLRPQHHCMSLKNYNDSCLSDWKSPSPERTIQQKTYENMVKIKGVHLKQDNIVYVYGDCNDFSHTEKRSMAVSFNLGIDLSFHEKQFIKWLSGEKPEDEAQITDEPIGIFYAKIIKIYSNGMKVEFMHSVTKCGPDEIFFVSYHAINLISPWLVDYDYDTDACTGKDVFHDVIYNGKRFFREQYYPIRDLSHYMKEYTCPCCEDFVIQRKRVRNQNAHWNQLFEHVKLQKDAYERNKSPNKPPGDYSLYIYNTLMNSDFGMDHHVIVYKFYEQIHPLFDGGITDLQFIHPFQSDQLNTTIIGVLKRKILTMKFNVLQQFPMPPSCAMVHRFGVKECSVNISKYILFIHGYFEAWISKATISKKEKVIKSEIPLANATIQKKRNKHDKDQLARSVMRNWVSSEMKDLQICNIPRIYMSSNSKSCLEKDVEFYVILHYLLLGIKQPIYKNR